MKYRDMRLSLDNQPTTKIYSISKLSCLWGDSYNLSPSDILMGMVYTSCWKGFIFMEQEEE